jgi:hypothetical protein
VIVVESTGIEILEEIKGTKTVPKKARCKCHCGKEFVSKYGAVLAGRVKSCGCSRKKANVEDIVGNTFGKLTVVRYIEHRNSRPYYECSCECGGCREVERGKLLKGEVLSCGCLGSLGDRTRKHGKTGSKEFHTWSGMRQRCNNPKDKKYSIYGGRGIKVCEHWEESFENFFEDMGEAPSKEHSIDRIDVNGDYEPSNCRWATKKEQANNVRNNIKIHLFGVTKTLAQWCDELNLSYQTVWARIKIRNYTYEKALGLW